MCVREKEREREREREKRGRKRRRERERERERETSWVIEVDTTLDKNFTQRKWGPKSKRERLLYK